MATTRRNTFGNYEAEGHKSMTLAGGEYYPDILCDEFGKRFRPIREVQAVFASRPLPDEAMCAILWECREDGTMREDQDRMPRKDWVRRKPKRAS